MARRSPLRSGAPFVTASRSRAIAAVRSAPICRPGGAARRGGRTRRPEHAARADGRARSIAVDTDVLVHAHRAESPKRRSAHARAAAPAESPARRGIPVFCIGKFVRVVAHPRPFDPPHTADEPCEAPGRPLAPPSARVLCLGPDYPALFAEAVCEANATGNPVFDTRIVAVCRESGVSCLPGEDRDFARFGGFDMERLPR